MRIHFLVEGKSEQVLIEKWAPRALPGHDIVAHAHQGKGELPRDPKKPPDQRKRGLLDLLPATLQAYAEEDDCAVLVLVDADDDDVIDLQERLATMLPAISKPERLKCTIAIEETEAFYLGDLRGLKKAYPHANIKKAKLYEPDSICGTAELFATIIGDDGMNKVAWAENMGATLTSRPEGSKSPSFRGLLVAMREVSKQGSPKPTHPQPPKTADSRRAKHWKSRYSAQRKKKGPKK